MSIWQNKDGSEDISRNSRSSISSIGIIGGEFSPERDPLQEEKYHNWIEVCANNTQPCSHTIEETEQYFLQQCEVVPMEKDDKQMKNYQRSVIMNNELKKRLIDFPIDINTETIEKLGKIQSDIYKQIKNTSPENYGIKTSGYYLPQTERNLYLYEEFKNEMKRIIEHNEDLITQTCYEDICFFFDKTTGDIQCRNGGRSLISKLIIFRGVSEEDIKLRNIRFQEYLSFMREAGNISDYR